MCVRRKSTKKTHFKSDVSDVSSSLLSENEATGTVMELTNRPIDEFVESSPFESMCVVHDDLMSSRVMVRLVLVRCPLSMRPHISEMQAAIMAHAVFCKEMPMRSKTLRVCRLKRA